LNDSRPDAWPTQAPLSQQWMTPELIAETKATWSPEAGRCLTDADAVEILGNVKAYLEVMLRIEDEYDAEQRRKSQTEP
jgi:hypothetical protein